MARKRKEEPEKDNSERWLLTYSDLITLLMVFFVVMYAMSNVDAQKFKAVADALSNSLGGSRPAMVEIATNPNGPSALETGLKDNQSDLNNGAAARETASIQEIKAKIDKFAEDNNIQTKLVSSVEERGLVVSIQDTLLFESGQATVTPYAQQVLEKVSTVLSTTPNYIKVEGHTDNLPINTPQFPSNWELSSARATNVLEIMIHQGITPRQLSAVGYGEYRPTAPNLTEVDRAKNRRVDLIILRSKYDVTEPTKVQSP